MNDGTLADRVRQELAALVDARDELAVEVARCVVTLRGRISDPDRARRLANAAIGVDGVDFVQNLLDTRRQDERPEDEPIV